MKELVRKFILENWDQDWEERKYFTHLTNGDVIGYDDDSETFSINNYWNEKPYDEIEDIVGRYGLDL